MIRGESALLALFTICGILGCLVGCLLALIGLVFQPNPIFFLGGTLAALISFDLVRGIVRDTFGE